MHRLDLAVLKKRTQQIKACFHGRENDIGGVLFCVVAWDSGEQRWIKYLEKLDMNFDLLLVFNDFFVCACIIQFGVCDQIVFTNRSAGINDNNLSKAGWLYHFLWLAGMLLNCSHYS